MRPQRTPIFIGCEGQSEFRYAGWLLNLVRDRNLPFHLQLSDLGLGAGDPLTRINLAADRLKRMERNRVAFGGRFLFLDADQLAANPVRARQAKNQAVVHNFTVIWQEPTHEAFLLRHLPGCHTHQPQTKMDADRALARRWEGYNKPAAKQQLEQHLTLEGARRVAADLQELQALLIKIDLM